MTDISEVKADILKGEDGLGSIVKVIAKKNTKVDKTLHGCNAIGCECADKNRVPLLIVAAIIGVASFGCSLCGMFGLWSFAIGPLPWGQFTNVTLTISDVAWWQCGPVGGHTGDADNYTCLTELFMNNSAMRSGVQASCGNSTVCSDLLNGINVYESLMLLEEVAHADWHLNQWGMCLFPISDTDTHIDGLPWPAAAMKDAPGGLEFMPDGALCRPWTTFHPYVDPEEGEIGWAPPELMNCATPGVDAFSLIMGTFGGCARTGSAKNPRAAEASSSHACGARCAAVMKIPDAFARMSRTKDKHGKTIVLIILVISFIPPIIGIISFSNGCVAGLSRWAGEFFDQAMVLGAGCNLFMLSALLYIPYGIIHVIIPASATTAMDAPAAEAAGNAA